MIDWILSAVPWWAWAVAAGLALGLAWRVFGWQGMVAAVVAVLTLGAYRQGRLDGRGPLGKRHDVNRDDVVVGVETAPPKKRRSVVDILRGR